MPDWGYEEDYLKKEFSNGILNLVGFGFSIQSE
jgi:hypothetical protein